MVYGKVTTNVPLQIDLIEFSKSGEVLQLIIEKESRQILDKDQNLPKILKNSLNMHAAS
jgi:hypothetical protein